MLLACERRAVTQPSGGRGQAQAGSTDSPAVDRQRMPSCEGLVRERHSPALSTLSCLQTELKLLFVQQISVLYI